MVPGTKVRECVSALVGARDVILRVGHTRTSRCAGGCRPEGSIAASGDPIGTHPTRATRSRRTGGGEARTSADPPPSLHYALRTTHYAPGTRHQAPGTRPHGLPSLVAANPPPPYFPA